MIIRLSILISIAIAAGAFVAGCGDDESSAGGGTISTSSLTKAAFIKKASSICQEGNEGLLERIERYWAKHEGSSGKSEGEVTADAMRQIVVPLVNAQIEEIEDLGAPPGDESQIEAFLAAQRRSTEALAERQTFRLQPGLEVAYRQPGKLAERYGLEACAYG